MPLIPIEHTDDPRLAAYRDVPEPELVRARGLFVAEGRLIVRRILEDRALVVRSLLLGDAACRDLQPLLESLHADVPVYRCATADFLAITGFNLHRGCLALVERPAPRRVDDLLAAARRVVVLEDVANADNVGGVFRNALAFGVDAALLSPRCCDPLYRKAVRTSMAATLRLPFARVEPWPAGLGALRSHGFTLVALTPRAPSELIDRLPMVGLDRVALVAGAEGPGLSAAVEAAADYRVRIPMRPDMDSLNVAVAAGIALYELARRRSV
jgi:tRNA G18 (ribose-2'-O)-methylase SpoU